MKSRNISLLAIFTALCATGIQAANPFAPENHPLPSLTPTVPHEPISTTHPSTEEPANPFAPHMTEPEHHEQMTEHKNLEGHNPFAPHIAEPEHHEITTPVAPLHQGHISTAQHADSIKTLHITPGHSTALEPMVITKGIEAESYFIQDKQYESYLTDHIANGPHGYPTERTYSITVPATVHVGSFTIFKAQGMRGIPSHLEPAYHVEIQGNAHVLGEGTQYPEAQTSTAVDKLTQLEEKYLTGIQTQFKAFTQEVRELISTAHANGESLEAAKLHTVQTATTKDPLKLTVGESHAATSFAGGSAQSSNPAIVSTLLKFTGTKTAPKWELMLTAHEAGEAIITYSTGSESYLQPVVVEKSSMTMTPNKPEHAAVKEEPTSHEKKQAIKITHEENRDEHPAMVMPTATEEESSSEEADKKITNELAQEDEPFASFLKESPDSDGAEEDEESPEVAAEPEDHAEAPMVPLKENEEESAEQELDK